MNPSVQTVGGGPATGLANEFTQWLSQGLMTGQFGGISPGAATTGANPMATTMAAPTGLNMMRAGTGGVPSGVGGVKAPRGPAGANSSAGLTGIINDILSGGAGNIGGSLQKILATQQLGDVTNLRSRYSMGGTGTGSPSAYAESLYRANAAPQAAMQIGQLQMSALMPLLQLIAGISGRGIPQASTTVGPSPFSQVVGGLGGLAESAGGFATGLANLKKVA
jgi:hypothetical protein